MALSTISGSNLGNARANALILVTLRNFSGVSSVSFDNCFSNRFILYKLYLGLSSSVNDTQIYARLRKNGSDYSSANYKFQYIQGTGTTINAGRTTTGTFWEQVTRTSSNIESNAIFEIMNPFQPTYATAHSMSPRNPTGTNTLFYYGYGVDSTDTYDGISFVPLDGGTITGSISIYGYYKGE